MATGEVMRTLNWFGRNTEAAGRDLPVTHRGKKSSSARRQRQVCSQTDWNMNILADGWSLTWCLILIRMENVKVLRRIYENMRIYKYLNLLGNREDGRV